MLRPIRWRRAHVLVVADAMAQVDSKDVAVALRSTTASQRQLNLLWHKQMLLRIQLMVQTAGT
jgi:hypothetical protein